MVQAAETLVLPHCMHLFKQLGSLAGKHEHFGPEHIWLAQFPLVSGHMLVLLHMHA